MGNTLTTKQRAVLEALRSGEYVQISEDLAVPDRDGKPCRCAEGVLIDVALDFGMPGLEWVEGETYWDLMLDGKVVTYDEGQYCPPEVFEFLGLPESFFFTDDMGDRRNSYIHMMNDSYRQSLGDIADIIEKNLTQNLTR